MESLADELLLLILSLVPVEDLLQNSTCSLVCKRWHSILSQQYFWIRVAEVHGLLLATSSTSSSSTSSSSSSTSTSLPWKPPQGLLEAIKLIEERPGARGLWKELVVRALAEERRWQFAHMKPENMVLHSGCSAVAFDSAHHHQLQQEQLRKRRRRTKLQEQLHEEGSSDDHEEEQEPVVEQVYVGLEDGTLLVTDVASGQVLHQRHLHFATISHIAVGHEFIATASFDSSLFLWEKATFTCAKTLLGHEKSVTCAQIGHGELLFVQQGRAPKKEDPRKRSHERSRSGEPYPEGRDSFIVSGGLDGHLLYWDLARGKAVKVVKAHEGYVLCLQFDTQAKLLVSGGSDRVLRLWDLATADPIGVLEGHKGEVACLHFEAATGILVSGSYDGDLRVWSLLSGACLRILSGHRKPIYSCEMRYSVILSVSGDSSARLWNWRRGTSLRTLKMNRAPVDCGTFGANRIICGSNNTVAIWSILP